MESKKEKLKLEEILKIDEVIKSIEYIKGFEIETLIKIAQIKNNISTIVNNYFKVKDEQFELKCFFNLIESGYSYDQSNEKFINDNLVTVILETGINVYLEKKDFNDITKTLKKELDKEYEVLIPTFSKSEFEKKEITAKVIIELYKYIN